MFNKAPVIVGNSELWGTECASSAREVGTMGRLERKEVRNVDFLF